MKQVYHTGIALTLIVMVFGFKSGHAEIKTEEEASIFLGNYCIELVSVLQLQHEDQKILAEKKKWKEVLRRGEFIRSIAEVYNNLCK